MAGGRDERNERDGDAWRACYDAGRARWPAIDLRWSDFVAFTRDREVISGDDSLAADVYLACACAHGSAPAIAAFEQEYDPVIDHVATRLRTVLPNTEDPKQIVKTRLFVGSLPKIAEYKGKGSLRAWLRVVAARALLNRRSSVTLEPSDARTLEKLLPLAESPEFALLRADYAEECRGALAHAASQLDAKTRTVLRLAFVEGWSIDRLGELYEVHRATAARWVKQAQEKLATETRTELRRRLGVTDSELESILRVVQSSFDTTLTRYLS